MRTSRFTAHSTTKCRFNSISHLYVERSCVLVLRKGPRRVSSIRSDETPEYVGELADFVDAHLRRLAVGTKVAVPQRLALLVAMQLADDLFRARDLHDRFRAQVQGRLDALEAALAEHQTLLSEPPT